MSEPYPEHDFFESQYGVRQGYSWRSHKAGPIVDLVYDIPMALKGVKRKIAAKAAEMPVRKVLIASVVVPKRKADLDSVLAALGRTKHDLTIALAPLENRGKYHNINVALAGYDLKTYDWLIVTDDDVDLPEGFLDNFLYLSEFAGLKLSQPAHKAHSYYNFNVTHRGFGTVVRKTHFVECGPITAFHRDILPLVFPFPELRWAWGMDVHWSEIARNAGMDIGVVDATPLRHLKPVAKTYSMDEAVSEGRAYLRRNGVTRPKEEIMCTVEIVPVT